MQELGAELDEAGGGEVAVEGEPRIRSERISAKLVASTKEYSRSSWRRSRTSASSSSSGAT